MPKSRHRPGVHKQPPPPVHENKKPASAVLKITLMICLLGLAIGALATDFTVKWMVAGSVAGALGGFLIGLAVDRVLAKKHLK